MLGSVGLWRAVIHRARAEWPVEAAAFLLLLCATTLLATGALYGDTVALGGLRRAFLDADPVARSVIVRTSAPGSAVAPTDQAVGPEVRRALASSGGEVALVVRSASLAPAGLDAADAPKHLTRLAAYEGIADHADLQLGRWPDAGRTPVEAALSEGAAAELGLTVGQKVTLTAGIGGETTVPVEVVGVWGPHRDDAYWLGDPLELDGIATAGDRTTRGPFVVARDDLAGGAVPGSLELQWRGLPDPDGLRVEAIDTLGQDVAGLADRIRARPGLRDAAVSSGLPEILATVERAILVSRSTVTLLTIQFAVLAGYAVLLVGGMMVDRRRAEAALYRSRGATTGHLAALSLGEAILLAIPAVILAPVAAVGLVRLIGSLGPLAGTDVAARVGVTPGTIGAALIAGIGGVLVLTLPSLSLGGPIAGVRATLGRQVGRTLPQRLGLDLILVALAVVALWQLSLYGAPITRNARGVLGLDPLLVAAPAIGLLAGAVVATRLVPRLAEIGERIAGRRRGVVPPLGARQLARRPLRYTRSALLLILAAALGTFAATSAATWTRSQADQAAYRAAGDVRLTLADYPTLPAWGTGSALRGVPGIEAASPVVRTTVDVGRTVRDGQLLAIDPDAMGRIVTYPPGPTGRDLPALVGELRAGRPTTAGVAIPGAPERLSVTVSADLHADPGFDSNAVEPDWPGLGVSVVLRDADGRLHRLAGEPGRFTGTNQRIDIPLSATVDGVAVRPTFPVTLEGVEVEIAPPLNIPVLGTVEVTGVAAGASASGSSPAPIAWDPGATGWGWSRDDQSGVRGYRPPAGSSGRLEIGVGADADSGPAFGTSEKPAAAFRSLATPAGDGVVPVIASELFLERTGARVGDTTTASTPAGPLTFRIVGSAAAFPPLDPTVPFLVADATTLETADFAATGYPLVTKEWWLATDPARTSDLLAAVDGSPYGVAGSVGRAALARSLATDPVPLGVLGALALGSIAALVFAAVGFIVGATVSAGERRGEFALLRALGLSVRQLSGQLSIESAFLLVVGLGGGTILGLVLAWLVLPYSTLSVDGSAVVPPPTIVVPWEAIVPLYALSAILLVVTVLVMSRQVPGDRISGVLRATDG